jgi:hypothetical protein
MADSGPRGRIRDENYFFYFSGFNSNEFYSNSNDFEMDLKTKALNSTKTMHDSMNATSFSSY